MTHENDTFREDLENFNGEYPPAWRPEPGDELFGILRRYSTGHTNYGPQIIATIEDEDTQELRSVWLMHTVLHGEFKKLKPQPGERLGIKRLSDHAKGYCRYILRVDREEPLPDFAAFQPPGTGIEDQNRGEAIKAQRDCFADIDSDPLPFDRKEEPKVAITDEDIPF